MQTKTGARARRLTEEDMLNTAMELTDQVTIFKLGLKLGLEAYAIEAALTDHPHSIREAAYYVLRTWRDKIGTDEAAYEFLGSALLECRLTSDVLDYNGPPMVRT